MVEECLFDPIPPHFLSIVPAERNPCRFFILHNLISGSNLGCSVKDKEASYLARWLQSFSLSMSTIRGGSLYMNCVYFGPISNHLNSRNMPQRPRILAGTVDLSIS